MFTNLLPKTEKPFQVQYAEYAKSHYLKDFEKKYPGSQWEATDKSIQFDLARLRMPNNDIQQTQQVDELRHKDAYWLVKYDFRVAKTKESSKTSGNRCVVFIDNDNDSCEILLIYNKNHLPKNKDETFYIFDVMKQEYGELYAKLC